MDLDALKSTLEQAGPASVAIGFAAGFLFSFNPVALASIPVSLAYVTKAHETKRAVVFGSMFVLGMILTHVFLGLAAGLGGAWVQKLNGRQWGLLLGPLLILLGFVWPDGCDCRCRKFRFGRGVRPRVGAHLAWEGRSPWRSVPPVRPRWWCSWEWLLESAPPSLA